jgi:IS30 family transposase
VPRPILVHARNNGLRGYRPKQAHEKALVRRSAVDKQLITAFGWTYVEHLLREEKWSPEQIHGRLTHLGWQDAPSPEHIYRHVYADLKAGGDLRDCLRGALVHLIQEVKTPPTHTHSCRYFFNADGVLASSTQNAIEYGNANSDLNFLRFKATGK